MKPYEWMVKCTPQTEWIERRGILFWLAFFFIELGAGAFFIASFFNVLEGMVIGWLICSLLGGGFHLLYLGRPLRFLRMFLRPQSSWISRGIIFVTVFLLLGLVHIVLTFQTTPVFILLVAADIFAFLVMIYGGFAMCCVNGIPLWNTALLPILYVVGGLWGGAGITLGVAAATGLADLGLAVEEWTRLLVISFIILLFTYLVSVRYGSLAAKKSIEEIVKGRGWPIFWVIVIVVGIGVPISMLATAFLSVELGEISKAILYATIVCELVGDLSMRYLILKFGFYNPLIPTSV